MGRPRQFLPIFSLPSSYSGDLPVSVQNCTGVNKVTTSQPETDTPGAAGTRMRKPGGPGKCQNTEFPPGTSRHCRLKHLPTTIAEWLRDEHYTDCFF
jgi:hypothetical protein